MSRRDENWLTWTLATIGFLGTGFAAGLHRLIWGLFLFLTAVWWLFCWYGGKDGYDTGLWWALAIAPPIAIGFVLRIIELIVLVFFGALSTLDESARPQEDIGNQEPK